MGRKKGASNKTKNTSTKKQLTIEKQKNVANQKNDEKKSSSTKTPIDRTRSKLIDKNMDELKQIKQQKNNYILTNHLSNNNNNNSEININLTKLSINNNAILAPSTNHRKEEINKITTPLREEFDSAFIENNNNNNNSSNSNSNNEKLSSNNSNNFNNNNTSNNDSKYLHKKFKRIASTIDNSNSEIIINTTNTTTTAISNLTTNLSTIVNENINTSNIKLLNNNFASDINNRLSIDKISNNGSSCNNSININANNNNQQYTITDLLFNKNNNNNDEKIKSKLNLNINGIVNNVNVKRKNCDTNIKDENSINSNELYNNEPLISQSILSFLGSPLNLERDILISKPSLLADYVSGKKIIKNNNNNYEIIPSEPLFSNQNYYNNLQQIQPNNSTSVFLNNQNIDKNKPIHSKNLEQHPANINAAGSVSLLTVPTSNRLGITGNNSNNINNNSNNINLNSNSNSGPNLTTTTAQTTTGRHVCPYCNLNCTKPSVLQKHIRAHTNERPYPCEICGFAFKTKSNYYKHCRSRSHSSRLKGIEPQQQDVEDDINRSGSDQEPDPDLSSSSSDMISGTASPLDERTTSPSVHNQQQQNNLNNSSSSHHHHKIDRPYKPKFHNASLYTKEERTQQNNQIKQQNIPSTFQSNSQHHNIQKYGDNEGNNNFNNNKQQLNVLSATTNLHNNNNNNSNSNNNDNQINNLVPTNYYSTTSSQKQQILYKTIPSEHLHHTQLEKSISSSELYNNKNNNTINTLQSSGNNSHRSQIGDNESLLPPPPTIIQQPSSSSVLLAPHYQQVVRSNSNANNLDILNNKSTTMNTESTNGCSNNSGNNSNLSLNTVGHQLNVEFLQEHITKLISQNQAIVEKHDVLLQKKKYPKQSNKQQKNNSHNINNNNINNSNSNSNNNININSNNNNNSNNSGTSNVSNNNNNVTPNPAISTTSADFLQTTTVTTPPISNSSGAKLAMALAHKQQQQVQHLMQQHQQLQHQHQEQQQKNYMQREEFFKQKNSYVNGAYPLSLSQSIQQPQQPLTFSPQIIKQQPKPKPQQQIEVQLNSQPLNLSAKLPEKAPSPHQKTPPIRKRSSEDIQLNQRSPSSTASSMPNQRSIIKDLLLNSRGLGVPNGEGDDAVYTCPLCKNNFQTAEELKFHTSHDCQGGPSSAPISPVASPSMKCFRSNSFTVQLPEFNNPYSLAKLAKCSLHLQKNPLSLAKLAWSQLKTKPSNLVLNTLNNAENPGTSSENSRRQREDEKCVDNSQVDTPLPSPGPLLGKTPLVEAYNERRASEDVVITKVHSEPPSDGIIYPKRLKFEQSFPTTSSSYPVTSGFFNNDNDKLSENSFFTSNEKNQKQSSQTNVSDLKLIGTSNARRFSLSGGCIIPIQENEQSPKIVRTPLLSGGSFTEVSMGSNSMDSNLKKTGGSKLMMAPLTPNNQHGMSSSSGLLQHFQFPPINSITAFNPLTLPPMNESSVLPNGEKIIPFIPGIPGPNTISLSLQPPLPPPQQLRLSPSRSKNASSPLIFTNTATISNMDPLQNVKIRLNSRNEDLNFSMMSQQQRSPRSRDLHSKKSFNFSRIAENLSPKKQEKSLASPEKEERAFNFDKLNKPEIKIENYSPLHVDCITATESGSKSNDSQNSMKLPAKKSKKFLRPTTLPLKPGTFTPKRHHGITPTANTMPLISPETPRPSKTCGQMFLNGHAYTYLNLKCSTKMFYCTVNCPQPSYVANIHKLSMYSVWQVQADKNIHPLGLKPKEFLGLYDSRHKVGNGIVYSMSVIKLPYTSVHSQHTVMTPFENNSGQFYHHQIKSLPIAEVKPKIEQQSSSSTEKPTDSHKVPILVGGYESNEDYTYIRGRGRGRYVCSECGIRCKKPSMLKKHIRTHTDVRPYTCTHCNFSFKTKGNLTKHMQSKTHYKKCMELGVDPGEGLNGEFVDHRDERDQEQPTSSSSSSLNSANMRAHSSRSTSSIPGESESDDDSDGDDRETESSDTDESKSRLPEHEAARCLLSLSMTPTSTSTGSTNIPISLEQNKSNENKSLDQSNAAGRKIISSFTSPKPPFDYQKQEKYYANPSLSSKQLQSGSAEKQDDTPIDLTKPRAMNSVVDLMKVNAVIGNVSNESGLMKSLVSITDRIRPDTDLEKQMQEADAQLNSPNDANLQIYLTEQALKYAKIKQSQMNNTKISYELVNGLTRMSCNTVTTTTTMYSSSVTSSSTCPATIYEKIDENTTNLISENLKNIKKSDEERSNNACDVEAKEIKPTEKEKCLDMPNLLESPTTESNPAELEQKWDKRPSAKSVASEYLKMTLKGNTKTSEDESFQQDPDNSSSNSNVTESSCSLKPPAPPSDFSGILSAGPRTVVVVRKVRPVGKVAPVRKVVVVGKDSFENPPTTAVSAASEVTGIFTRGVNPINAATTPTSTDNSGRPVCTICSKTFQKQHQLTIHMNIHYMERKFKCEPCAVSFRTQGHLQKHERSEAHRNKVQMTTTFGVPTTSNPRPFECSDCKVAFRIHGHLAKHLRSKTHVQKLECLQKLPFGTYAAIERVGINLTEIDTTDCDNSLASLKLLAQKLIEKDPSKLSEFMGGGQSIHQQQQQQQLNSGDEGAGSELENNNIGNSSAYEENSSATLKLTQFDDNNDDGSSSSLFGSISNGIKRKLDSFSSSSNDSFSGGCNLNEKRIRTTSIS